MELCQQGVAQGPFRGRGVLHRVDLGVEFTVKALHAAIPTIEVIAPRLVRGHNFQLFEIVLGF